MVIEIEIIFLLRFGLSKRNYDLIFHFIFLILIHYFLLYYLIGRVLFDWVRRIPIGRLLFNHRLVIFHQITLICWLQLLIFQFIWRLLFIWELVLAFLNYLHSSFFRIVGIIEILWIIYSEHIRRVAAFYFDHLFLFVFINTQTITHLCRHLRQPYRWLIYHHFTR